MCERKSMRRCFSLVWGKMMGVVLWGKRCRFKVVVLERIEFLCVMSRKRKSGEVAF